LVFSGKFIQGGGLISGTGGEANATFFRWPEDALNGKYQMIIADLSSSTYCVKQELAPSAGSLVAPEGLLRLRRARPSAFLDKCLEKNWRKGKTGA